jgi:MFS family permease
MTNTEDENTRPLDVLVEEMAEDAASDTASPMTGMASAIGAGASFLTTATHWRAQRLRRDVQIELPAYILVQLSWFMAFGLQMVLFPYLITDSKHLGRDGLALGLANVALSAPSVIFLLLGGVVAERADGRRLLILLHLLACLPAFALAWFSAQGGLSYAAMIAYGLTIGTIGAFMMPARDSIVNEVVERRMRIGSGVTLQLGVTLATMAQFVAQIIGLTLAGYADKATRMPSWLGGFTVGPIIVERLLIVQGCVLLAGSFFALWLARGRQVRTGRKGITAAFGDMAEGFRAVCADGKLWAMTILMFGVGVFVIGSFVVILPIVNRDVYGFSSDGIRDMFVTFWMGAFVSSVVLSVFRRIKRQGRLLLIAQFLGSTSTLLMLGEVPHWVFLGIIFLWGIAGGISIAMSRSIVQDAAPKDKLARVMSFYQLGFMAGTPLGAALMGALVDTLGPQRIAIVPAGGMAILIAFMIFFTPVWNMKGTAWLAHQNEVRS